MGVNVISHALTLNEARFLCRSNSHLNGTKVQTGNGEAEVVCVAVSPADDINKWIFLQHYIDIQDAEEALDFYKVPFFDVILIIRDCNKTFSYKTLRPLESETEA